MKIKVTTDLEGSALVKALSATALAHGVDEELRYALRKSENDDKHEWMDWEKRLRELSGDESVWDNPKLQRIEDTMVKYVQAFAADWIDEARYHIRRLIHDPSEVTYKDFLKQTETPTFDLKPITDKLVTAKNVAREEYTKMRTFPTKGEWIKVPEPPHVVRPAKPQKNAEWIARQSAASKMREWAEGMREDVRWQVVQAIRDGIDAEELEKRLRQRWDDYGQSFRTIAATELSMAYNDAALTLMAGKHVVVPPIGDDKVCKTCKYWLEGKVFYVSPTPIENPTKQELEQYLWPGKSNIGRKRGDLKPCLPLHPNCRHVAVLYRGGDPYQYRTK